MHLDIQTLSVVTVFITALLGALLVFAGLQNRSIRAPMWWGAAHIVNAVGLGLLTSRGTAPDFVTVDLANALVLLGYGLTWSGARLFDGRAIPPYLLLAPAAWLLLCRIPGFAAGGDLGAAVVSTMLALLALLTAEEFWRGRDEPLMSRWPSVIVLLAYAAVLLARVPATLLSPVFAADSLLSGLSFALLAFGTLLFTVVPATQYDQGAHRAQTQDQFAGRSAERRRQPAGFSRRRRGVVVAPGGRRRAAGGHAVRPRSLQTDQRPLRPCRGRCSAASLRRDRYGHALGAEVLFARIGGEEFASCLPVGDLDEAFAIADRVRRNFAAAAARFGADELPPTVSGGVTLGCDPHATVTDLLSIVDRALYRAKEHGRNRVETETPQQPSVGAPSIVPIIGRERAGVASAVIRRWRTAS